MADNIVIETLKIAKSFWMVAGTKLSYSQMKFLLPLPSNCPPVICTLHTPSSNQVFHLSNFLQKNLFWRLQISAENLITSKNLKSFSELAVCHFPSVLLER